MKKKNPFLLASKQFLDNVLNIFNTKISEINQRSFDIVGCHCQVHVYFATSCA